MVKDAVDAVAVVTRAKNTKIRKKTKVVPVLTSNTIIFLSMSQRKLPLFYFPLSIFSCDYSELI